MDLRPINPYYKRNRRTKYRAKVSAGPAAYSYPY